MKIVLLFIKSLCRNSLSIENIFEMLQYFYFKLKVDLGMDCTGNTIDWLSRQNKDTELYTLFRKDLLLFLTV